VRLTVIIPTYNRSDLLGRTLRGLLDQTAPPDSYEIVVVDDGSTDVTPQVVRETGAPDSRLRYLRQENKGPAAARNLGVREAKGQIVLFTGDDCLPDSRLVEEHLRAHDGGGDVGVVGHVTWHPSLTVTPFMAFLETGPQFGFSQIKDPDDAPIWCFYTANCSVRRHWMEEVGGFDEHFKHAAFEDIELAYRMHKRGLRLVYRRAALTYHHHATTLQQHMRRQRLVGRAAVLFFRKHPELRDPLRIGESMHPITGLRLYQAASAYAYGLGVMEGLQGKEVAGDAELEALWSDAELTESGREWEQAVFGQMEAEKRDVVNLRVELERMYRQWEEVTSRRLYRWSEWLARVGWGVLRGLGLGGGASRD
jgi:glycosyltransferase involved in cell wall biosynthesis